jgi:2-phospho-L-lactate guanylyltransferase
MTFSAIMPLKAGARAKSRLHDDPSFREAFAAAFASDTYSALAGADRVARVIVISADADQRREFKRAGAYVLRERGLGKGDDLNQAIRQALVWLGRRYPNDPVAVVPSDLPSLNSRAVDEALVLAQSHESCFVADRAGTGTTLLAATSPRLLTPAYGPDSAAAHWASGATALTEVDPRLKADVDVIGDLAHVGELGVGPHTTEVVSRFDQSSSTVASRTPIDSPCAMPSDTSR